MSDNILVLLKISVFIPVLVIAVAGLASFVMWENVFNRISAWFALRITIALIAYAWVLYLIPGVRS